MGCGHSKINIYPKRSRNKSSNNNKKTVTQARNETELEETVENEPDESEEVENTDRKTIKIKSPGGPLLAQKELSSSQQNFFKMLDEKIENGPDYDSSSEIEKAAEAARLIALMKDWETASVGSRSLPVTPKKHWWTSEKYAGGRNAEVRTSQQRTYPQMTQSVVHQSYGISPHVPSSYHQSPAYNPPQSTYHSPPPHQPHPNLGYPYQALSPLVGAQMYQPQRHYNSPRQSIPQNTPYAGHTGTPYNPIPNHTYSNGELIQQQMYSHQLQYQQVREYQQYRQAREQQLLQMQQQMTYQSNAHVPFNQTSDTPMIHRTHYEMT